LRVGATAGTALAGAALLTDLAEIMVAKGGHAGVRSARVTVVAFGCRAVRAWLAIFAVVGQAAVLICLARIVVGNVRAEAVEALVAGARNRVLAVRLSTALAARAVAAALTGAGALGRVHAVALGVTSVDRARIEIVTLVGAMAHDVATRDRRGSVAALTDHAAIGAAGAARPG